MQWNHPVNPGEEGWVGSWASGRANYNREASRVVGDLPLGERPLPSLAWRGAYVELAELSGALAAVLPPHPSGVEWRARAHLTRNSIHGGEDVLRVRLFVRTGAHRKPHEVAPEDFDEVLDAVDEVWAEIGGLAAAVGWLDEQYEIREEEETQERRLGEAQHLYNVLHEEVGRRAREAINYEERLAALEAELDAIRPGVVSLLLEEEREEGWLWTSEDGAQRLIEAPVVAALLREAALLQVPPTRSLFRGGRCGSFPKGFEVKSSDDEETVRVEYDRLRLRLLVEEGE